MVRKSGGETANVFTDLQEHDKIKKDWCSKHGFKLIEIPYHCFDEIQEILEGEVCYPEAHSRRS